MAEKPRQTIRLSPSYDHALDWIATRKSEKPAELARSVLHAYVDKILAENAWRAQWQDAYNAELNARAAAAAGGSDTRNRGA